MNSMCVTCGSRPRPARRATDRYDERIHPCPDVCAAFYRILFRA
jgi:hypothetical protein